MSQGFVNTNGLPLPLPVTSGGTGVITSTGSGAVVLNDAPLLKQPDIVGVTNGSSAAAGSVGELRSNSILFASAIAITTATPTNVTSLVLLPVGEWFIWGNVYLTTIGTPGFDINAWISTSSATLPDRSLRSEFSSTTAMIDSFGLNAPNLSLNLVVPTTVYLTTYAAFAGTANACGNIYARRVH